MDFAFPFQSLERMSQVIVQFVVAALAFGGIDRHHSFDGAEGFFSDSRRGSTQINRSALQPAQLREGKIFGLIRRSSCQGMKESRSQTEDIASEILGPLVEFLGRNVIRRAPNLPE